MVLPHDQKTKIGDGLLPNEDIDLDAWENLTLAVAAGRLSRAETAATLRKLLL